MSLRRLRPGSRFGGPRKILECFGDYPRTIPGAFGNLQRQTDQFISSGDWLGISAAKSFGFGDRVENSLFLKRDGLWMIACPRVRAQHEAGGGGVLQHAVRDSRIQRLYISLIGKESLLEQKGYASNGLESEQFTAYSLLFTVLLRPTEFRVFCKGLTATRLNEIFRCSYSRCQKFH